MSTIDLALVSLTCSAIMILMETENQERNNYKIVRDNFKRGGPYSKKQRLQLIDMVYRLHFEQGLPATRIAEILGTNRNTVSSYIQYLYQEMADDWEKVAPHGYVKSACDRLESDVARLMAYLDKAETLEQKLAIEKQIAEIHVKLAQLAGNIYRASLA